MDKSRGSEAGSHSSASAPAHKAQAEWAGWPTPGWPLGCVDPGGGCLSARRVVKVQRAASRVLLRLARP
jgi:hypothetical protein